MKEALHLSEAQQRDYFDRVMERSVLAESRVGVIEEAIEVGGTVIRLVFSGANVRDLLFPALSHLRLTHHGHSDFTFHIWESAISGVAMISAPRPAACFTDRGDIWTMRSTQIRSAFHYVEDSLNLLDLTSREGICWIRNLENLPFWTFASPLRTLLGWCMESRGNQLLHAAAVGTPQGGLLITGKGGSGKSTTALNCLRAGFAYVGDDYVVVSGGQDPAAHSLYRTAKIEPEALDVFASFEPISQGFGTVSKAVITLDPSQVTNRIGLNAILTPQLSASDDTNFLAAPHRRMLEAAAFTTLSHLPCAGQPTIDFLEYLMGYLPTFVVELGEPDRVPAALSGFLATLEAPKMRPQPPPTTLVSVIVPVHNGAHFLFEAIESIRAQNHPALDIIVIDDGSTDDLAGAVRSLAVDIRFLPQDKLGPAAARNRGIRNAIGDYIAFLDVDDVWPAGTIAAGLAALQANPELGVAIGRAELVTRDEEGDWVDIASPDPIFPNYISAALFRRRAFERVGLFDEMLWFAEDVDWFARADELGIPIERLDRISLRVRRHDANMTHGRTPAELTPLRLVKNMLDRRRARAAAGEGSAIR